MGNNLCKERYDRAGYSKNPIDQIVGRCCDVMCPNYYKKQDKNQNFQACPCTQKSQANTIDSWRTNTLNAPGGDGKTVIDKPPVAPPRKKRVSINTILAHPDAAGGEDAVKNGFKDVFGSEELRRMSSVTLYKEAMEQSKVQSTPIHRDIERIVECYEVDAKDEEFSDFSNNPTVAEIEKPKVSVPRVGNKKSDKFFGENLSDSLSDELYNVGQEDEPARDKIDAFVEKNVMPTEVNVRIVNAVPAAVDKEIELMNATSVSTTGDADTEKSNSLDNKAKFLMAMLEDYSESEKYKDKEPISEAIIVPKKRPSRHICDHDDHMHTKFHNHEKCADQPDSACPAHKGDASHESGPKKPDRDFSRYRKSLDMGESSGDAAEEVKVHRPIRTKRRTLSRENLPSPPALPTIEVTKSAESKSTKSLVTSKSAATLTAPSDPPPPVPPKSQSKKTKTLPRIISMPSTANANAFAAENVGTPAPTPSAEQPDSASPRTKEFKKCQSSNTFLTEELMSQIVKKALSFSYYAPEDFPSEHRHEDGSAGPKSKLASRQVSVASRTPTATPTSTPLPTPTEEKSFHLPIDQQTSFSIGNHELPRSKKISFCEESPTVISPHLGPGKAKLDAGERKASLDRTLSKNHKFEELFEKNEKEKQSKPQPIDRIVSSNDLHSLMGATKVLDMESINHVINQIYDGKTILKDFQDYLDENLNAKAETKISPLEQERLVKLHTPPPLPAEKKEINEFLKKIPDMAPATGEEEKIDDIKIELVADEDLSSNQSELDDCFDKEFEKIESDAHFKPKFRERRRESIEDMDDWFASQAGFTSTHPVGSELRLHNRGRRSSFPANKLHSLGGGGGRSRLLAGASDEEVVDSEGETVPAVNKVLKKVEVNARLGRRGSDGGILNYDTTKLYPFGKARRERTESMSSDFFEGLNESLHNSPLPMPLRAKNLSDEEFQEEWSDSEGEKVSVKEQQDKAAEAKGKKKAALEVNLQNGGGSDHSTLLKIIREKEKESDN